MNCQLKSIKKEENECNPELVLNVIRSKETRSFLTNFCAAGYVKNNASSEKASSVLGLLSNNQIFENLNCSKNYQTKFCRISNNFIHLEFKI